MVEKLCWQCEHLSKGFNLLCDLDEKICIGIEAELHGNDYVCDLYEEKTLDKLSSL